MAVDPEQPFNREESYLASAAGENVDVPPCPWSRKEAYLAAIGGRLDTMDDRISALATDLSFKGSVATENDLPADAAVGDTYITEDTGIMYVWVGEEWVAINDTGGGGSGIVTLTSDDLAQYSSGIWNNDIGLWKLPAGIYMLEGVNGTIKNQSPYTHKYRAHDGALVIVTGGVELAPGTGISNPYRQTFVFNGNNNSAGTYMPIVSDYYGPRYLTFSDSTGQNTDRGMTQKAITDLVGNVESILQTLNSGNGAA